MAVEKGVWENTTGVGIKLAAHSMSYSKGDSVVIVVQLIIKKKIEEEMIAVVLLCQTFHRQDEGGKCTLVWRKTIKVGRKLAVLSGTSISG